MVFYCCVPHCRNRIGGHKFPKQPRLRLLWRLAVRRKSERADGKLWEPSDNARVCYDHFLPEDYKPKRIRKVLREKAVPSVFNFGSSKSRKTQNHITTSQRPPSSEANGENIDDIPLKDGSDEGSSTEDGQKYKKYLLTSIQQKQHTNCSQPGMGKASSLQHEVKNEPCGVEDDKCSSGCIQQEQRADHSHIDIREVPQTSDSPFYLDFEKALKQKEFVTFYTGFHNQREFMMFYDLFCPAALHLVSKSELGPKVELFIVLTKLRTAKSDKELGFFFNVPQTTISRTITTWMNLLYFKLKEFGNAASNGSGKYFPPTECDSRFSQTGIVEIPGSKPENVSLQLNSFSSSKNSMKGIKREVMTYTSDYCGWNTSDNQCDDQLAKFRGDRVPVKKESTITSDTKNTQASLRDHHQLGDDGATCNSNNASMVHVAKAIRLERKFQILHEVLNHSDCALTDRIVFICLSLANFFPSIADIQA